MARRKPGQLPPDPAPESIDDLVKELKPAVRVGLDNVTARRELSELQCVQERAIGYPTDDDGLTQAWRDVIRTALDALDSEDDRSRALRLLLGADAETSTLSAAERRARAAAILNIAASTLRKNHEPKLLRRVAEQIYRLEHPPPTATTINLDTADGIAALDDVLGLEQAEPQTDTEDPSDEPSADEQPAGVKRRRPLSGRGIPQIFVRSSPQLRQVYSDLRSDIRDIRDQYARRQWLAVFGIAGVIIVWRYGLDALPRYTAVLSVAGIVKYGTEIVTLWRRAGTAAFDDRLPQISILVMVAALSGSFIATSSDDSNDRATSSCYLSVGNPDCTSSTTDRTIEIYNSVPTTYAIPGAAVEPECPPPGNTERQIAFTAPPRELCINTDSTYIANVETNYGTFELTLNASGAPYAVNNFVFLARWHFYDGITLTPYPMPEISASYLASNDPVEQEHQEQAPGYTMVFDAYQGPYPEDEIYAVLTTPYAPHRWSLVIGDTARQQIHEESQRRDLPLLGEVTDCEDIISDPAPLEPQLQPRFTSTPIVIDTITIRELPPGTTTSTTRLEDPHCREEQQAQLEEEYGD